MNIHDRRALRRKADENLSAAPAQKKIIFVYLAASMVLSVAMTVIDLVLNHFMQETSGLRDFATRSVLETAQTILPYVNLLFLMCWDLGYSNCMLKIARGQHTDEKSLTGGFYLFGVALRSTLLQFLIYFALILVCSYAGSLIFMMTPFASPLLSLIEPYVNETTLLSGSVAIDEAVLLEMEQAMLPAVGVILIVFAAIAIPISYRLRMVNYALLDEPHAGAIAAIRSGRKMMQGNCKALFRLDLSFWWYYLLCILTAFLCYGDVILSLCGVTLPLSETASAIIFYALYFAMTFAVNVPLKNKVSQTYALAYEAIRPQPQSGGGVVLGNIFQM